MRQAPKRRARNAAAKSAMATAFRRAVAAISAKEKNSKAMVTKAVSIADKAVERGVVHRNTAARKKSRLLKKYNSVFKK